MILLLRRHCYNWYQGDVSHIPTEFKIRRFRGYRVEENKIRLLGLEGFKQLLLILYRANLIALSMERANEESQSLGIFFCHKNDAFMSRHGSFPSPLYR